jgi:hypothetical protein
MAITNAQQARQLYRRGGDTMGGPNDRSKNRGPANSPFSSGFQGAKKASTPTRSRIQEDRQKDYKQNPDLYKPSVKGEGEGSNILNVINPLSKDRRKFQYNTSMLIPGQKARSAKMQRARINYLKSLGLPIPKELEEEELPSANFFVGPAFDRTSIRYKDPITDEVKRVKTYGEQIAEEFGAPGVMMSGNVGGLEKFVKTRDADGKPLTYGYTEKRGGGRDDSILPISQPVASIPEPTGYVNPLSLLTPRIAGTRFLGTELEDEEDIEFAADGGRIGLFLGGNLGGGYSKSRTDSGGKQTTVSFGGGGGGNNNPPPVVNPVSNNEPAVNPIFRKTLREPELQLDAFIKKMALENAMKEEDDEEKNLQEILAGTITNQPEFQSNIDATISGIMDNPDLAALGTIKQGMAEGGRAELAGGGMPYEGGIMDLESGRQMYFLGKLVKKATRAIKKITKSPIGKAALLGGLGYLGATKMGGMKGLSSFFGKGSFNPLKALITKGPQAGKMGGSELGNLLAKFGLAKEGSLTGKGMLTLGAGVLPFLAGKEEDNFDIDAYYAANRLTPGTTKRQMGSEFDFYNYNLAEGGMPSKEPVAKKTMPLLDMDGQEMDLRAEGGFVPLGRMERADDVPARLSKNEFVFTADAVRNAGEGDIDKGAEVMYNMMKNLESGGEVSEESQGLDGAREMFQTSKRLEEVL